MNDQTTRLHAIVSGLVQGVNFRANTREHARQLGLSGWVRNRYDGTVETVAEGPRRALEQFAHYLRHGPPSAHVTDVKLEWSESRGEFAHFDLRW
jgi:acylphosphatase